MNRFFTILSLFIIIFLFYPIISSAVPIGITANYNRVFFNPVENKITHQSEDFYSPSNWYNLELSYEICEHFEAGLDFGYLKYNFKNTPPVGQTWDEHSYNFGFGLRYYLFDIEDNPCDWHLNPFAELYFNGYYRVDSYSFKSPLMNETMTETNKELKYKINPAIGLTYSLTHNLEFDLKLGYNSVNTDPIISYYNIGLGARIKF